MAAHVTDPKELGGPSEVPPYQFYGAKENPCHQMRISQPNNNKEKQLLRVLLRCTVCCPTANVAPEAPSLMAYKMCRLQTCAACQIRGVHKDPVTKPAIVDTLAACQPLKSLKGAPTNPGAYFRRSTWPACIPQTTLAG